MPGDDRGFVEGRGAQLAHHGAHRLVVGRHGEAVDTHAPRCLASVRQRQQGTGNAHRQVFRQVRHGDHRPLRVKAGGQGVGIARVVLLSQDLEFPRFEASLAHQGFEQAGAHKGDVGLVGQQGFDDAVLRQAGFHQSPGADALARQLGGLDLVASEGQARDRGNALALQVLELRQVMTRAARQDDTAHGTYRPPVFQIDQGGQGGGETVLVHHADVLAGLGDHHVYRLLPHGLLHGAIFVYLEFEVRGGDRAVEVFGQGLPLGQGEGLRPERQDTHHDGFRVGPQRGGDQGQQQAGKCA
jgi:hypothetical protein